MIAMYVTHFLEAFQLFVNGCLWPA